MFKIYFNILYFIQLLFIIIINIICLNKLLINYTENLLIKLQISNKIFDVTGYLYMSDVANACL